jgi:hypothetical protein
LPGPTSPPPATGAAAHLQLDDASVALIESSHAAKLLAAADSALVASGVAAFSCRVSVDRRSVEVVVSASQAAPVLANLAATRRVALVACDARSFRTVQLKGEDAVIAPASDADRRDAVRYCEEFAVFAASAGFPLQVTRVHIDCPPDDAVVVRFSVRHGFNQTPGPAAGQPLATAAP